MPCILLCPGLAHNGNRRQRNSAERRRVGSRSRYPRAVRHRKNQIPRTDSEPLLGRRMKPIGARTRSRFHSPASATAPAALAPAGMGGDNRG